MCLQRASPKRKPLRSPFRLSGLVANPLESSGGNQAHNQEVVATETGGVLPVVSVLVGPLETDIKQWAFVGLLAPDAGTDGAMSDFVNGLVVGFADWCLISHAVSWFVVLLVRRESVSGTRSNWR